MKRHFVVRRALLVTALVLALPVFLLSASTNRSMIMDFFNPVVDQQTSIGCSNPPLLQSPGYSGGSTSDPYALGPTTAWNMLPWPQPPVAVASVQYADGVDCNPSTGTCMSVQLNKNLSTLSVDSRNSLDSTTGQPRYMAVNFNNPCPQCPYGGGPANPFGSPGGITNTPGLLSIFLTIPFTNMGVCTSTDCPEAESGTARFWFDDPKHTANLQWRIDWGYIRVLRVSSNTWYAMADGCDGSQVATLYKLANNRKSTSISRQGSYLMPFFISGVQ